MEVPRHNNPRCRRCAAGPSSPWQLEVLLNWKGGFCRNCYIKMVQERKIPKEKLLQFEIQLADEEWQRKQQEQGTQSDNSTATGMGPELGPEVQADADS